MLYISTHPHGQGPWTTGVSLFCYTVAPAKYSGLTPHLHPVIQGKSIHFHCLFLLDYSAYRCFILFLFLFFFPVGKRNEEECLCWVVGLRRGIACGERTSPGLKQSFGHGPWIIGGMTFDTHFSPNRPGCSRNNVPYKVPPSHHLTGAPLEVRGLQYTNTLGGEGLDDNHKTHHPPSAQKLLGMKSEGTNGRREAENYGCSVDELFMLLSIHH